MTSAGLLVGIIIWAAYLRHRKDKIVLKTGNLNRGFISIHIVMLVFACYVYIEWTFFLCAFPKVVKSNELWFVNTYNCFPIALDIVLLVIIQMMQRNKSHQRSVRFVTTREERKQAKIQAREDRIWEVQRYSYK